jgi:hypothetical protein
LRLPFRQKGNFGVKGFEPLMSASKADALPLGYTPRLFGNKKKPQKKHNFDSKIKTQKKYFFELKKHHFDSKIKTQKKILF